MQFSETIIQIIRSRNVYKEKQYTYYNWVEFIMCCRYLFGNINEPNTTTKLLVIKSDFESVKTMSFKRNYFFYFFILEIHCCILEFTPNGK